MNVINSEMPRTERTLIENEYVFGILLKKETNKQTTSDLRKIKYIECRMHNAQPQKSDLLSFLLIHAIWWCWHGFVFPSLIFRCWFLLFSKGHIVAKLYKTIIWRIFATTYRFRWIIFCMGAVWMLCVCAKKKNIHEHTDRDRMEKNCETLYPFSKTHTPITQIAMGQCVVGIICHEICQQMLRHVFAKIHDKPKRAMKMRAFSLPLKVNKNRFILFSEATKPLNGQIQSTSYF